MRRALWIIFAFGWLGIAFSGVLTIREFTAASAEGCSAVGARGTILGYPPCVYGLVMYTIITAIAAWGLWQGRGVK